MTLNDPWRSQFREMANENSCYSLVIPAKVQPRVFDAYRCLGQRGTVTERKNYFLARPSSAKRTARYTRVFLSRLVA